MLELETFHLTLAVCLCYGHIVLAGYLLSKGAAFLFSITDEPQFFLNLTKINCHRPNERVTVNILTITFAITFLSRLNVGKSLIFPASSELLTIQLAIV